VKFKEIKKELENKVIDEQEFRKKYMYLKNVKYENVGTSGKYEGAEWWTATSVDGIESFDFYVKEVGNFENWNNEKLEQAIQDLKNGFVPIGGNCDIKEYEKEINKRNKK
jgi:hypothetical protein